MNKLIDSYGREVNYLRVSVTERCNFRCQYCMPEKPFSWTPKENLLSFEDMFEFMKVCIDEGINKIRITGGEPLLREDLDKFIKMIYDYEPTIDLDPVSAEEVLSIVARWAATEGRAAVITTHRLEEVERICDRILFLQDGEAILQDDLDDLRARWKLVRASGSELKADEIATWAGVRRVEAGPGWIALTVDEDASQVAERLRDAGGADVVVEGVNLREVYLTLTDYQRGRLDEALESVV